MLSIESSTVQHECGLHGSGLLKVDGRSLWRSGLIVVDRGDPEQSGEREKS
jgi:hypothetical protein